MLPESGSVGVVKGDGTVNAANSLEVLDAILQIRLEVIPLGPLRPVTFAYPVSLATA